MEHGCDLVFASGDGKQMVTLNKRWAREELHLYPAYD